MKRKMMVLAVIASAILTAAVWLSGCAEARKSWDVEYPFANAKISWEQTYYPGSWK